MASETGAQRSGPAPNPKSPPASKREADHPAKKMTKEKKKIGASVANKDDGDAEEEFKVQRILGHSFVPDTDDNNGGPAAATDTHFLVAWAGTDASTGRAWAPTWERFRDVGEPLIAGYFHGLTETGPGSRPLLTAPDTRDGRVYTYADNSVPHQPVDQGPQQAAAPSGKKKKTTHAQARKPWKAARGNKVKRVSKPIPRASIIRPSPEV